VSIETAQTLPQSQLISIVIVTADSGVGVVACIERALTGSIPVEVIVADNASRDGIASVEQHFAQNPQVRILHNGKNLGFGAACNRAALLARGDALLFLNPDCLIEPDTLARLRAVLDDARIGLVGALQVDAAGGVDAASRRRDPLLRRALVTLAGLRRLRLRSPAFEGVAMPPTNGPSIEPVDVVSGALMLLPRAVFERIGGFDEGYFLHCEDIDLCRRVRDAGLRVVCVNDVVVVHGKGGSSRHRPVFVAWHKHRGMWRWFVKFDPAARNPLLRALVWCGIWTAFALKLPLLVWRGLFAATAL
jgi:GT2 family glycosyltransferase